MKGRIFQLHTSIPLKCGTSCLFIKFKLGRVGMGRVLHLGPSWHGPSFMWAELAWAELSCTLYFNFALNLYMTLSSADNPFKQIGPRSGSIFCPDLIGAQTV